MRNFFLKIQDEKLNLCHVTNVGAAERVRERKCGEVKQMSSIHKKKKSERGKKHTHSPPPRLNSHNCRS